jgi:hypothetical protein
MPPRRSLMGEERRALRAEIDRRRRAEEAAVSEADRELFAAEAARHPYIERRRN